MRDFLVIKLKTILLGHNITLTLKCLTKFNDFTPPLPVIDTLNDEWQWRKQKHDSCIVFNGQKLVGEFYNEDEKDSLIGWLVVEEVWKWRRAVGIIIG